MFYPIYSKLRAIYSYLPSEEEINTLIESRGLSGFNKTFNELNIVKRFPLLGKDMDKYCGYLHYLISNIIIKTLSDSSKKFFTNYFKIYELKDIKSALHGKMGRYLLFKEDYKQGIEHLDSMLRDGFWGKPWRKGYTKYIDTGKILDIEKELEQFYYQNLIKSSLLLPLGQRTCTEGFLMKIIDLKNQVWIYRLKNYYKLETFEIRSLLIPEGEIFNDIKNTEGLTEKDMNEELYRISYNIFKQEMYTMCAIVAFLFVLDVKLKNILSIYYSRFIDMDENRTRNLLGIF